MKPLINTLLLVCILIASFIIVSLQITYNPYYASFEYFVAAMLIFLLLYKSDKNLPKNLKWGNIIISSSFILFGFLFAQSSIFMIFPLIAFIYLLGLLLVGSGIYFLLKSNKESLETLGYSKRSIYNKVYNGIIALLTAIILIFIIYMWSVDTKSSDGQIFITGVIISIWMIICLPLGIMSYKTRPKQV